MQFPEAIYHTLDARRFRRFEVDPAGPNGVRPVVLTPEGCLPGAVFCRGGNSGDGMKKIGKMKEDTGGREDRTLPPPDHNTLPREEGTGGPTRPPVIGATVHRLWCTLAMALAAEVANTGGRNGGAAILGIRRPRGP